MGKSYTATIDAKAWKEHTCRSCGGQFAYLLRRAVRSQASTAEAAEASARRQVGPTLAVQVDTHPCPHCGVVQPDMIGQRRSLRHIRVFFLAPIVMAVLFAVKLAYGLAAPTATAIILSVGALAVLLHLLFEFSNPNRNLEANRLVAGERVTNGLIRQPPDRPAARMTPASMPGRSPLAFAAALLLLAGVAAIAYPEAIRRIRAWPSNDRTWPVVVGPGDKTRIYMDQSISSVKGYWRGTPVATLTSPGEKSLVVDAQTNSNNWGSSISVKSSEKQNSSTPWVEVRVPEQDEWAGKTVRCHISLDVVYPEASGSSSFEEQERTLISDLDVRMAPPHAGELYDSRWLLGTGFGIAAIAIGGLLMYILARGVRKHALPTQLYPLDAATP